MQIATVLAFKKSILVSHINGSYASQSTYVDMF